MVTPGEKRPFGKYFIDAKSEDILFSPARTRQRQSRKALRPQDTIIIHIPPARLGRPRSGPDASRTSSGVEGEPRAAGRFAGLAVSVRYPVSNSMSIMTLALT